jgi:hypothetical protein
MLKLELCVSSSSKLEEEYAATRWQIERASGLTIWTGPCYLGARGVGIVKPVAEYDLQDEPGERGGVLWSCTVKCSTG